jgi:hypothetical protein
VDEWRKEQARIERDEDQLFATWAVEEAVKNAARAEAQRYQLEQKKINRELKRKKTEDDFNRWWKTLSLEEQKEYYSHKESMRLEKKERKRLKKEEQDRLEQKEDDATRRRWAKEKRKKEEEFKTLELRSETINSLSRYTQIGSVVTQFRTIQLKRKFDVEIYGFLIAILLGVLILASATSLYSLDPDGFFVTTLNKVLLYLVPLFVGLMQPAMADFFTSLRSHWRLRRDFPELPDSPKELVLGIVSDYKKGRGLPLVQVAVASLVSLFLSVLCFGPISDHFADAAENHRSTSVAHSIEVKVEARNLKAAREMALTYLTQGKELLRVSSVILDRQVPLADLKSHLGQLENSLKTGTSKEIWALISSVMTDTVNIGTLDEYNLRK